MRYVKAILITAFLLMLIPMASAQEDIVNEADFGDFREFDLSSVENQSPSAYRNINIHQLAMQFNVCESEIKAINPEWLEFWELDPHWYHAFVFYTVAPFNAPEPSLDYVRIPVNAPNCFRTVEWQANQSLNQLAQEYNICEIVFWTYNSSAFYPSPYNYTNTSISLTVPIDTLPCYDNGQVLRYENNHLETWDYYPAEQVQIDTNIGFRDFVLQNNFCAKELGEFNRPNTYGRADFFAGDMMYIPEDAHTCSYIEEVGASVQSLSLEYNVCMEDIIDFNYGLNSWSELVARNAESERAFSPFVDGIFLPTNLPPCYDENGLRIGWNDREVHKSSPDDWLFKIAQEYQVCIQDLMDNNPLLEYYPDSLLPSLIFIPDVAPCSDVQSDGMVHYQADGIMRYNGLTYIYNVCASEFEPSPNQLQSIIPEGAEVLIPADARPCYDFYVEYPRTGHYFWQHGGRNLISYLCYEEAIDLNADYTGHEPAISPVAMTEDTHCYDVQATPEVIYNNEHYILYPFALDASLIEVAACFGVNPYDIAYFNAYEILSGRQPFYGYWGIQNPSRDCPLITGTFEEAQTWKRQFRSLRAYGELAEDGLYTVNYGDTLSAIGRRYGYLPQWIIEANSLPSSTIYYGQTLVMPNFPNLYQIATIAGIVLAISLTFLAGTFVLQWRRNGRKSKKKRS